MKLMKDNLKIPHFSNIRNFSVKVVLPIVGLCCSQMAFADHSAWYGQYNIVNKNKTQVLQCSVFGVPGLSVVDSSGDRYETIAYTNPSTGYLGNKYAAIGPTTHFSKNYNAGTYMNTIDPLSESFLTTKTDIHLKLKKDQTKYVNLVQSKAKELGNTVGPYTGNYSTTSYQDEDEDEDGDGDDRGWSTLALLTNISGPKQEAEYSNSQSAFDAKKKLYENILGLRFPIGLSTNNTSYVYNQMYNTVVSYQNVYIANGGTLSQVFEFVSHYAKDVFGGRSNLNTMGLRCNVYENLKLARSSKKSMGYIFLTFHADLKKEKVTCQYGRRASGDHKISDINLGAIVDQTIANKPADFTCDLDTSSPGKSLTAGKTGDAGKYLNITLTLN